MMETIDDMIKMEKDKLAAPVKTVEVIYTEYHQKSVQNSDLVLVLLSCSLWLLTWNCFS